MYQFTTYGKNQALYMGEKGDKCFLCGHSLENKQCIQAENEALICLENCQGGND